MSPALPGISQEQQAVLSLRVGNVFTVGSDPTTRAATGLRALLDAVVAPRHEPGVKNVEVEPSDEGVVVLADGQQVATLTPRSVLESTLVDALHEVLQAAFASSA